MKTIFVRTILWLMQTHLYAFFVKRVLPYIRFSMYYTKFHGYQYCEVYSLLRLGDIILANDPKRLNDMLTPGEFTHAALVVSKDGKWEISEMTHDDYTKSCLFDVCKESERIVVLRCRDFDEEYIRKVVEKCKSLQDTKYDIEFVLGIKALYCSELVYVSDFENRLQVSLEDLVGLGRPYISPNGLYAAKNCDVVFDSRECKNPF
jgi:hypothetical protein